MRPPPRHPLRLALLALAVALASAAPAALADPKCFKDRSFQRVTEHSGVELSIARFCDADGTDARTHLCPKLVDTTGHARELKVQFEVVCEDATSFRSSDDRYELPPHGANFGADSWWTNWACMVPCAPRVLPIKVSFTVTDVGAERARAEAERARAEAERVEAERKQAEARAREERERAEEARRQEDARRREEATRRVEAERAEELRRHEEERRRAIEAEERRRDAIRTSHDQAVDVAKAQQKRVFDAQAQAMGTLLASEGGGGPRPTSAGSRWHARLALGLGGYFLPVMTDATGADINGYSSATLGGGAATMARLEFWPVHSPSFGMGLFGSALLAYFPTVGGDMQGWEGAVGARAFVGSETGGALLLEVSHLDLSGSSQSDVGGGYLDAWENGAGSGSANRLGVGLRACTGEDHGVCNQRFELLGLLERQAGGAGPHYGLRVDWDLGFLTVSGEAMMDQLALGSATYPVKGGSTGARFSFLMSRTYDWFGDRRSSTGKKGGVPATPPSAEGAAPEAAEPVNGEYGF